MEMGIKTNAIKVMDVAVEWLMLEHGKEHVRNLPVDLLVMEHIQEGVPSVSTQIPDSIAQPLV
jgi:hypothetical protein